MKEEKNVKSCQYCRKKLKRIDSLEEDENSEYNINIHELITFILWFISLFLVSYKKRLEEHKLKMTCINKDCIGYLDGYTIGDKYTTIWQYPKKKGD